MVPPNSELTTKWSEAIDRTCSETMARIAKEAGAR
jgi:hypothetical protein